MPFKRIVQASAAILFAAALLLLGTQRLSKNSPPRMANPSVPRFGFNLVGWDPHPYAHETVWRKAVGELGSSGIHDVTLVTYRFVNPDTGVVSRTSAYGLPPPPERAVLLGAIREAQNRKMRVSVNPMVEIDNAHFIGRRWRGELFFTGQALSQFFESYERYLSDIAELADNPTIERIYLGSELKLLSSNGEALAYWQQLITTMRRRCPDTLLTYAANHDNAPSVLLWPYLDEIAVDAYYPLAAAGANPTAAQITRAWEEHLASLRVLSEQHQRPVVISEWGCVPFQGTTATPWKSRPSRKPSPSEQLNAYLGTIEACPNQGKWLKAVFFWHWAMPGNERSNFAVDNDSDLADAITERMELVRGY